MFNVKQIGALIAGLGLCVVCLADSPQPGSPLAPIVLGGDKPEPRGVSSCKRDFGSDELGVWITQTVRLLCKKGDADSLLSVFLFAAPQFGSHGDPDWTTLDRAYARGHSNPVVLWTIVLTSKCRMPFQASECDRMQAAARLLAEADPDNAMAWLARAYAADQNADYKEMSSALDHGASVQRFHDYAFDVAKRTLAASGQLPIPESVLRGQKPEQFRLQIGAAINAADVIYWLRNGCRNEGMTSPSGAPDECAKAKGLLQRGDSEDTLRDNPEVLAELKAAEATARSGDFAAYFKARVDAIGESSNERDWIINTARLLQK